MIKSSIIIILFGITLGCSKSDGGNEEQENLAPSTPNLIYPSNNLFCIENNLMLEWSNSQDPEGDNISYRLEVSENENFSTYSHIYSTTSNSYNITFEKGLRYFWRVKAMDQSVNESEYSSIFEFYTEGESVSNYLPYSPDIVWPSLNSNISQTEITLQWDCSDPDGDQLKYDVYLSTEDPPEILLAEAQLNNDLTTTVETNMTYYWKIVAKDDSNNSTVGQIWYFHTE